MLLFNVLHFKTHQTLQIPENAFDRMILNVLQNKLNYVLRILSNSSTTAYLLSLYLTKCENMQLKF